MAKYNLNEVLKQRKTQRLHEQTADGEVALDDVSRVKVLSPGRQVFKRFIRNRLAVFGSSVLILMFVFSFIGPLFYPYGQKQIFYKYDTQHVNYAMAKENTAYNGYVVDESLTVERSVNNAINSRIKSMIAAGEEKRLEIGKENAYLIEKLAEDIYTVSVADAEETCIVGDSTILVGTYSAIGKSVDFKVDEIEGLADGVNFKGSGGSFEKDGVTYTYEKGSKPKTFDIYTVFSGINYVSEPMDEAFEEALNAALEAGETSFTHEDASYSIIIQKNSAEVYEVKSTAVAKVFSRLTADTYVTGADVPASVRLGALMNAAEGGSFEAEGQTWTVGNENDILTVRDAEGNEFMELTPFSVRRYTGEDSMDLDLKEAITETVEKMVAAGEKSANLTYRLPTQGESGEYIYDDDGNLQYQETEMKINQRDTGEFVVTADQVLYVIDIHAAPSKEHILGTDGDGFDVMSRIMYGGRISLMVGFVVVFLEIFLGVIMGGLAGYYGGWVDMLIMRLVDIFYCLPSMPIMIILGAMMDALRMDTYIRLLIMMAALGIMGWSGVARLVRGQILSLREQEFMVATEATGIKVKDRIFHHLVPNVMPQLIVIATMGMGGVIITESTLSFLGLGVKHPLATWGTIINSVSSASAMRHYAFIWIPVGMLICLTVIAFNFVGDGLRDAYDPKAKR